MTIFIQDVGNLKKLKNDEELKNQSGKIFEPYITLEKNFILELG